MAMLEGWAKRVLGESPFRWALYLGMFTGGSRVLVHALGVWPSANIAEATLASVLGGMVGGVLMAHIQRSRSPVA